MSMSCLHQLENLRWFNAALPIGKVKAMMYRTYSPEERRCIDEFELNDTCCFKLGLLDYGSFDWNHEFQLPKHLMTVPQSLLHEVETQTLGNPNSPVDTTDAIAVNEYMQNLAKIHKTTWESRHEKAEREFALKCVEEVPTDRANSVTLRMAQYLGAPETFRVWYHACKDWNRRITSDPTKNAFGWMTYLEVPEDVTANLLANGEGAKCTKKKTSKKAITAKVEKLERTVTELKTRNGELKKKSHGGKSLEDVVRVYEMELKEQQTMHSDLTDKMQGLADALGDSQHKLSTLTTTFHEKSDKLRESETQNLLDAAKIKTLEDRVQELKGEVDWFKNQVYPPPASTGAHGFASGSMSVRNTVSPST